MVVLLLFGIYSESANALQLHHRAVPGGIALVDLGITDTPAPQVRFGRRRVLVEKRGARWFAVVGLSATLLPGSYILTVEHAGNPPASRNFRVDPADSTVAQIESDLPTELLSLPLSVLESQVAGPQAAPYREEMYAADLDFLAPVEARFLLPFGYLTTANAADAPIPHFGVTYFTPPDAAVYAPAAGRIEAKIQHDDGTRSLYIGHGKSLYSIVLRLSRCYVEPMQPVSQGELIGMVENTRFNLGRVDWGLLLNGALIDPLMLGH